MKRTLVFLAIGVVLTANLSVLVLNQVNRSHSQGGSLELTERELHLQPSFNESTVMLLDLRWDSHPAPDHPNEAPQWLNAAKLVALGFDCRVPLTNSLARDHYRSLPEALVFVVLEYAGATWKQAAPQRRHKTRLFAIDAARDLRHLREKYSDSNRYLISRAVIRVEFEDRNFAQEQLLKEPRLQGWINFIEPRALFVPYPYSATLERLRRQGGPTGEKWQDQPRFVATLSWGANGVPQVREIRLLTTTHPRSSTSF